ncbi:hypothetical protein [Leptospira stimsonii]|uniref:Uncharacterized protein n=1 Tax=Leptospira stimsonii TaxID=2202203 RepID=A0A396Z700_9LEPT|nr:hypothetical protein [Leptospira stimsonii]RHX89347.1 hypothetical protein DLM75_16060 [Leptospira stimsonii]
MNSHITVLIDRFTNDIDFQLRKALEPHRLDEDSLQSIRAHHWDYWIFPSEHPLDDGELKSNYLKTDPEILNNSSYIRNLPVDYHTSGIILLDGSWIDLQDFGWRMRKEPSSKNDRAWKKWIQQLKIYLNENKEQICVQVIVHC